MQVRKYYSRQSRAVSFILYFLLSCLQGLASPAKQALAYELPSSTGMPHIFFTADEAEYDMVNNIIHLKGRVKLVEKERKDGAAPRTMRAEEFHIQISSHIAVSPGEVLVEEGDNAIYGKSGWFNTSNREGALLGVAAVHKPWRIEGKTLDIKGGASPRHVYRKAVITSCSMFPPHYRIKASKLTIIPEHWLFVTNAVFYLGKVPVFYSPFFYKSLRPDPPIITRLEPGYEERNGFYLKSTTLYRFNDKMTGKLFLDYFARGGVGTGGEVDYNNPGNFRGNITGYRIREDGASIDRWVVGGGHWQKLLPGYYLQSEINLLSDPYLYNDYFRKNPFAVSPYIDASVALVRQTSLTTTRLSFSRRDDQIAGTRKFHKVHESRPRLDFRTSPITIKGLPVLHTFTGFYDSVSSGEKDPFRKSAGGQWTVTQTIPIVRRITIVPSGFYKEDVNFASRDTGQEKDLWQGRYGAGANLRYNYFIGDIDLGYSHARRLKVNRSSLDTRASDRGIETNYISFVNFLRPSRRVYARLISGYNLIHYRGYSPTVRERFAPVTGEISYTPNPNLNVFVRDVYDLEGGNQSFFIQADLGDPMSNHMGLGISYNSSRPLEYTLNQTMSLYPCKSAPSCSWHIDAVLMSVVTRESGIKLGKMMVFGKSLVLYKDFHDFRTSWSFIERPEVKEFLFTIDLKMGDAPRKRLQNPDSDRFWHPWRKEGEVRD